jgi:hypothetical protein
MPKGLLTLALLAVVLSLAGSAASNGPRHQGFDWRGEALILKSQHLHPARPAS